MGTGAATALARQGADAWHVRDAVPIGDAVHTTTPQIGYGAGLIVEDGAVLGEEMPRTDDLGAARKRLSARRYGARWWVTRGAQISRWRQTGQPREAEACRLIDQICAGPRGGGVKVRP